MGRNVLWLGWGHVSVELALALTLVLSLGSAGCVTSHSGSDDDAGANPPPSDAGSVFVAIDAGTGAEVDAAIGDELGSDAALADAASGDAAVGDAASGDAGSDASLDAAIDPEPLDASVADASIAADASVVADASFVADASGDPPVMTCPVGMIEHADGDCRSMDHDRIDTGFARCRIRDDATLWCWGAGSGTWANWQQPRYPTRVDDAADWATVSVGAFEVCGLKRSGKLACFGEAFTGNGPGKYGTEIFNEPHEIDQATDWTQVSAGGGFACGLKESGTLWCWGLTTYLLGTDDGLGVPAQIGEDTDWAQVASGDSVACALKHDGSLWCWGYNQTGQVGDGTTIDRHVPVLIAGGPYAQVELGARSCAVRVDGTLWCWGRPDYVGAEYLVPTLWDAAADWRQLASNGYSMCGLREGGKLACLEQSMDWKPTPVDSGERYVTTAVWLAQHEDGGLRTWGYPARGDGSAVIEPEPVLYAGPHDWQAMAMRHQRITGLRTGDRISTFGSVNGTSPWIAVATSGQAECAIRGDHTLWCWGAQFFGEPDAQYWSGNYQAKQVGTGADWIDVAMTTSGWACGIRASGGQGAQGTLWCAYPSYSANKQWFQSDWASDWTSVTAGGEQACGTRADGSGWCWKMSWQQSITFSQPNTGHDWKRIEAGFGNACGIRHDGSLWCWGANFHGQLGNGTRSATPTTVPSQVMPGSHWLEVTVAQNWTCGLQQDHSLWCWGQNTYGQLGVGFPGSARRVPARVGTDTDWEHVYTMSGADQLTCALRHGQRWCWGQNQIGFVTGVTLYTDTPVPLVELPEGSTERFCARPQDYDSDGYASCLHDCDDNDFDAHPDMPELCNTKDDDCDTVIDEGCP